MDTPGPIPRATQVLHSLRGQFLWHRRKPPKARQLVKMGMKRKNFGALRIKCENLPLRLANL